MLNFFSEEEMSRYYAYYFEQIREHICKGESRVQIQNYLTRYCHLTICGAEEMLDKFCKVTGHSFKGE